MTYWENSGKYQKENQIIWEKYVPHVGVNLTDDKKANKALIALIKSAKKYYRYYNDGVGIRKYATSSEKEKKEKHLEETANRAISRAWKATKQGSLSVVGFEPDIYGGMSEKEKNDLRDDWIRERTMSKEDYENYNARKRFSNLNMRALSEDIAEYEKDIAENTPNRDLDYMKKNLPIMKEVLKEKLKLYNKTGEVDFKPYSWDEKRGKIEEKEVVERSRKLLKVKGTKAMRYV